MNNTLYLIYDGDCILCRKSAQAIRIKKAIGKLELINARSEHPLVIEAAKNRYNLNEGILVKYNNKYYYGRDALHFLALVSSSSDVFNKVNGYLFKSKWLSTFFYPLFKSIRNILLFIRGIQPITNLEQESLIQMIYGKLTDKVPDILQKRYSNRPGSKDYLLLKGKMNIHISRTYSLLRPFFKLAGALVPYSANNIPVSVEFISDRNSNVILMHRTFYYKDKAPYHFTSRVIHIRDNLVIEKMKFGLSTKLIYLLDKNKIIMDYGGYAFHIGKWLIPIPLGFIIGKFYSFEELSDDSFNMEVKMLHPLFGKIFQYDGYFKIAELHKT